MRIAFILYPLKNINLKEDTSFFMMRALYQRGHHISYFESSDLIADKTDIRAYLTPFRGFNKSSRKNKTTSSLANYLDAIVIRKEPPFDEEYRHTLQILSAMEDKLLIINRPSSMLRYNEKFPMGFFDADCPPTLISSQWKDCRLFLNSLASDRFVTLKPPDDKSGNEVRVLSLHNQKDIKNAFILISRQETRKIIVQRYQDVQRFGDTRALLSFGKVLGSYTRWPKSGSHIANISKGATFAAHRLTDTQRTILKPLALKLMSIGIHFSGVDLIGDKITEINITSPAGFADLDSLDQKSPLKTFCLDLEKNIRLFRLRGFGTNRAQSN